MSTVIDKLPNPNTPNNLKNIYSLSYSGEIALHRLNFNMERQVFT